MKIKGSKSFQRQITICAGFRYTSFGIGFSIDRYSFNVDLGPFWFGIEY